MDQSLPRTGLHCGAGRGSHTREITVQQTRIERPRIRRKHPGQEDLPRDARDPDIVRAKALARGAQGEPATAESDG